MFFLRFYKDSEGVSQGDSTVIAGSGQLLRPDEDTLAALVLLIQYQRGAGAFQILDADLQLLEVHLVAAEVDRRPVRFHPQQPEGDRDRTFRIVGIDAST